MNEKYEAFKHILNRSKEYSFEGSVLTLRDYHTGETVEIDLSLIDQDTFEEIVVEEEEY